MNWKGFLPSRVVASYIFDYLIIVVFIVVFSALDKAEPFHQRFSVDNPSLQYPFTVEERIPPWLAAVVSCAFPMLVIIIWTMVIDGIFSHRKKTRIHGLYTLRGHTVHDRLWEMNVGILGLGLSVAAAVTITGALKNLTGKPRPDILDRCKLPSTWVQPAIGLSGWEQCTGNPVLVRDGFKSWPSGHSSVAFAGLGYFSIWLAGKMHVLDNRGEVWKTIIVLVPILAAAIVAVSRIMDARHHPFDVLSSSLLGMFLAWVSYRQYFPSIYNTHNKGYAYPIRSWGTEPPPPPGPAFIRAPDEEEGGRVYGDKSGRALASGVPVVGGGESPEQRRRQYLEEQENLERRRRQAHEPQNTYTGPNQPDPNLPPALAASGERDVGTGGTFEMRDQQGMNTTYQPYSSTSTGPPRPGKHSTDSSGSDDDGVSRPQQVLLEAKN